MKFLIQLSILVFFILAILSMIPYGPSFQQASEFFSQEQIENGAQYSLERRFFYWGSTFTHLFFFLMMIYSRWGKIVTSACHQLAKGYWILTILFAAAFYYLADALFYLPFGIGRWYHSTLWGMTQRSLADYLEEYAKSTIVNGVLEAVPLLGFYLLLRFLPRTWWIWSALGVTVLGVVYAMIMPLWIAPLFNTFTPLSQTKWAFLEPGVKKLIYDAKIPVQEILVMDASRQGTHTNAYFTGFGSTRQIVIYDTLLEKNTPAEVESVLGHEIGHWQHDHITKGILLGGVASLFGLFLLHHLLRLAVGREPLNLTAPWDAHGLPWLMLLGTIGAFAAMPIGNMVSRYFERQADWAALELAKQPEAFISAEKRLAIDNKGNVAPSPWNVWIFSTHPPAVERIRLADEWQKKK